jgi:NAD(P)-dependent dehydrogenase (short-subunit alcohol dehydrogenase family)
MLLENKVAVVYGAGGAIGSAVAKAFAREGARVFVTGRNLEKVDTLAKAIVAAGGRAEAAKIDALDEEQIENHLSSLANAAGRVDISFNAISPVPQPGVQGVPIEKLPVDSFTAPITAYLRSHFLTARAAARRMIEKGSGLILMNTPEPARLGAAHVGGMGPAWAAMEAFNRNLSAEFGPRGVRSVCIRSTGLPETHTIDVVFGLHAEAMGITREQFQGFIESLTHTKRSTKVADVANAAVWLASDQASAITGAVLNLTGGLITD